VLLVAGVTFYFAKRNIAERRKIELDEYKACEHFVPLFNAWRYFRENIGVTATYA